MVELGIVEGYYGRPWSWEARADQIRFLAGHGYGFYIYAPKADLLLRERWREDYPQDIADQLRRTAGVCAEAGVRFGVGLSPFEIWQDFGPDTQAAMARKLAFLDDIGTDYLGILFDDMRGNLPDLAESQARIVHWIAERTRAKRLIVCPTYYSDEMGLDTAFGRRPDGYVEEFGAALDPAIDIFWTGEEVCSREYSPGHLARVSEQLRRKPFLWDNYPVNDGPRMSPYLYLRAFTGRPAAIGEHLAAHSVNPALQPVLSRLPALSLAESYRLGDAYQYMQAFRNAATTVLGPELAPHVERHLSIFHDTGLDRLDKASIERLRRRYAAYDHPGAREIVDWLDGVWLVTREMLMGETHG
jgi:hypothetical protein